MGLDITAYRKMNLIGVVPDADEWEEQYEGTDTEWVYTAQFPAWAEDLEHRGVYTYEASYDFRAGSYVGYNRWREKLSMAVLGVMPEVVWANPTQYEDKPFYRLIHFSDCEGNIGTAVCAQLLADFKNHPDLYPDDEYFTEVFGKFQIALEYAADGGCLSFH